MGTKQGHVLGRLATEEEERKPQLGSVLLRRSAAHPLHAGVVGDVLAILQHFAALTIRTVESVGATLATRARTAPSKSLRRLVEEARRAYCERARSDCDLETLLSGKPTQSNIRSLLYNRRPYRDPNAQPVKWMKLIQWWLVHRVRIDVVITPEIESATCDWFKIPYGKWEEAKKQFPNLLPR
jgi:hypothetical protein